MFVKIPILNGRILNKMLKGEKVYLCAIEREDLNTLRIWRNNEELKKHFREYRQINSDMQEKWFENKVLNDKSSIDARV